MNRIELEDYPGVGSLTPDTCEALRTLAERAEVRGLLFTPSKSLGPQAPTGRSINVTIQESEEALRLLWSLAVPLGFTPSSRYPIRGTRNEVLTFVGPWQGLLDRLCGEGRGHLAWSALVKASDLDLDASENLIEFIQAQLHRVGANPGNIDGILGERTKSALEALGVSSDIEQAAAYLKDLKVQVLTSSEDGPWRGQVIGHGLVSIASHGQVAVTRTPNGAALTIEGPGRVIADFSPS